MIMMQCVNAYMAVQTLMDREMDYQTAYALVCLKKQLQGPVEFFQKEERRLMQEYAARDEQGGIVWKEDGRFTLRDNLAAEEYERKRRELGMVEVQKEFIRLRIREPEKIRPVILEALEEFLIFEEGTQ